MGVDGRAGGRHRAVSPSTGIAAGVPFGAVTAPAMEHPVRARLGRWPHEPDVAHLVLLDHQMVPTPAHVAGWIRDARLRGARSIRTGALFPGSVEVFADAGFRTIDTLVLMELDLAARRAPARTPPTAAPFTAGARLRRLRRPQLIDAAAVDRAAFGSPWANDEATLTDITTATPSYRARQVLVDGCMVGFAICGRAGSWGYVQRLAIHPDHQHRGLGSTLLADALGWMQRRRVARVLVNTAADNDAAIALYEAHGFRRRHDILRIVELELGHSPDGGRPDTERHG